MAIQPAPAEAPTGEPTRHAGGDPVGEVARAVATAREAFAGWAARPAHDRARRLARLRHVLVRNADRIAATISTETGKPVADAMAAEVFQTAAFVDYCARRGATALAPRRVPTWPLVNRRAWVEYHPRGVVGVISAWNYPFLLPMIPVASALTAGSTVVLKPSEVTPQSGALVAELAEAAGLPEGCVTVLPGAGPAGAALAGADVDLLWVTGSPETGRAVARLAAERLTPVVLELGGKDPMVVLEDADLARAARAAVWGAMFNAGQTCISIERAYVVDAVYDDFVAAVEHALRNVAAGSRDQREIGPMIHERQRAIVAEQVDDAVRRGARVLAGGRRGAGLYYEPTLLVDVDESMAIMREETFGPVLALARVPDEPAALARANDSAFGLSATVWTGDRDRGRALASRLRAGAVTINDALVNFGMPHVPFGGLGASGSGRQFGPDGLRVFCFTKSVNEPRGRLPPLDVHWFPRRASAATWRRLTKLLYGHRPARRGFPAAYRRGSQLK